MKVIKRYANRKLYDTESSSYVTLDDVAMMVKKGIEINVIDNNSREDLTAIILSQIIFEEHKKHRPLLPLNMLKKIIEMGEESINDFWDRYVASVGGKVDESRSFLIDIITNPQKSIDTLYKKIDERIKQTILKMYGIEGYRADFEKLQTQLHDIETKLQAFIESQSKE
jgi:polyhydroxyalkanoate synthesis repressor PhaR